MAFKNYYVNKEETKIDTTKKETKKPVLCSSNRYIMDLFLNFNLNYLYIYCLLSKKLEV